MPTSICLWSVVNKAVERGHHCRIISKFGTVYNSLTDLYPKDSKDFGSIKSKTKIYSFFEQLYTYRTWPYCLSVDSTELYNKVRQEISIKQPDLLVCSVGSVNSLVVGCRLKNEYNDLFYYVPCFFDALLSGPPMKYMSKREHDLRAIIAENRLLKNADSIVMMKAAEIKHTLYKDKLTFTNNIKYLDIPLYNPKEEQVADFRTFFPEGQKILFFAGSMPRNIRNPSFFLRLFGKMKEANIHLYIAGRSDYIREIKTLAQYDKRIHLLGILPHEQIQRMYREADYLVNIGNNVEGMIPSKIFEYMSFGKPIVSTYRIKNDPCVEYLKCYGRAVLINEKESSSIGYEKMIKFLNDNSSLDKDFTIRHSEKLYNNTPDAFVQLFESLRK